MLHLSKITAEDLSKIIALEQKEENKKWIIPYPLERHLLVISNPDEMHFRILDGENNFEGFVILSGLESPHDSIELRRIVIEQKEKGFGRTVLNLIIQYCFRELKCHRLWLDVFEDNVRARHLYTSIGFVEEGKWRESFKTETGYRTRIFMSILKNEFEANID